MMKHTPAIRAWVIAGIFGLTVAGITQPNDAQAVSCGTTGSLDTTHVQLTDTTPTVGGATYPISADDCAGLFSGNEVGMGGAGLLEQLNTNDVFGTGGGWFYLGESNSSLISFTSTGDGEGTFALDFSPDQYSTFALSLFGGSNWAVWLFDLAALIQNADGTYSMAGIVNPGGQIPDLSHIGVAAIPIPATLPLFLTGLLGLGFLARRRRQAAEA